MVTAARSALTAGVPRDGLALQAASTPAPPTHAPEASARAYAEELLSSLGEAPRATPHLEAEHPALACARSGLMRLTGRADGPALMCPAPVAACADGALAALASLAPAGAFAGLRGNALLGERAAITGTTRRGAVSPGGSCRLLQAADGFIALNLARASDAEVLDAWLAADAGNGDTVVFQSGRVGNRDAVGFQSEATWDAIASHVRDRTVAGLVERGRLLGLAVAPEEPETHEAASWFTASPAQARPAVARRPDRDRPLVIDLSSLWAGPLCGHLLQRLGAEVVKVESTRRPDGARAGPPAFFDLLNAGKSCVALDFAQARDRERLRALILSADIVIEASRPRALAQLGLAPEALLAANPRLTWLSITGYGRDGERANWIAYGDDAGVAGGLTRLMRDAAGERVFVGDAIADPLTGLHAALAAWAMHRQGGGRIVSLALRDVAAHAAAFACPRSARGRRERAAEWAAQVRAAGMAPAPPRARTPAGAARPLGADTAAVLARHGIG